MLDQKDIQLEARLTSIEYLLAKVLAQLTFHYPDDKFEQMVQNYAVGMEKQTFPGLDAATSDLVASEIRDEVLRLLKSVKEIRQQGQKP